MKANGKSTDEQSASIRQDEIGIGEHLELVETLVRGEANEQLVISIDGEWGVGKTFFLNRLHERFQEADIMVAFVNAWENDFLQDPLSCLIEELSAAFPDRPSVSLKGMKDAAISIAQKAMPHVIRAIAPGSSALISAVAAGVGDSASEILKDNVSAKKLLGEFRTELAVFAESVVKESGTRLVIIVDELDRCRPDFALRLLETVKHLFANKNIAFVVGAHRIQLAHSTQAIYGPNFDGVRYLDRFFNLELKLPQSYETFVEAEWTRRSLPDDPRIKAMAIQQIIELCELKLVSLRMVEHTLNRLRVSFSLYSDDNLIVFGIPQLFALMNFCCVLDRESFEQFSMGGEPRFVFEQFFEYRLVNDDGPAQYLFNLLRLYERKFSTDSFGRSIQSLREKRNVKMSPWIEFLSKFEIEVWNGKIENSYPEFKKAVTLAGVLPDAVGSQ